MARLCYGCDLSDGVCPDCEPIKGKEASRESDSEDDSEKGASTIEYAILVVMIAMASVLGYELLGKAVLSLFSVASNLPK